MTEVACVRWALASLRIVGANAKRILRQARSSEKGARAAGNPTVFATTGKVAEIVSTTPFSRLASEIATSFSASLFFNLFAFRAC